MRRKRTAKKTNFSDLCLAAARQAHKLNSLIFSSMFGRTLKKRLFTRTARSSKMPFIRILKAGCVQDIQPILSGAYEFI